MVRAEEDRINKPFRPVPMGLITEHGAVVRSRVWSAVLVVAGLALNLPLTPCCGSHPSTGTTLEVAPSTGLLRTRFFSCSPALPGLLQSGLLHKTCGLKLLSRGLLRSVCTRLWR